MRVLLLPILLAACAAPQRPALAVVGTGSLPHHTAADASSPEGRPRAARESSCVGLVLDVRIEDEQGVRGGRFECHADGATLSIFEGGVDDEGYSDEWQLELDATEALYGSLRTLALDTLACETPGTARRSLRVEGRGGVREVRCAADEAASWSALEERLWPRHDPAQATDVVWPFFDAEYWVDELRYAAGG